MELVVIPDSLSWLDEQFAAIPDQHVIIRPSVWAEERRYLPPSVTALPGPYRFDVAPYLREIVDCLSIDSPIREIAVMKGAQVGATVGVLENAIGYVIDHVRTAPCMLVTADMELAKLRMDEYIVPMLRESKLSHLIASNDLGNNRKSGKTDTKLEWQGGGFLIPFGAQSANKLRSVSIQFLFRDEIDGWPETVGRDGDPLELVGARTAAYESTRKVLDISTPLIQGASKIAKRFALGDQRYYYVRCLHCSYPQPLRWHATGEGGVHTGIVWETENDQLIYESVHWCCTNCHHRHTNDDKTRLLSPEYGAAWQPTARPSSPSFRSYHIGALYSPVGMQSWAACVEHWLKAWNPTQARPKSVPILQTFYNNVLGQEFEVRGDKLRFEAVSSHRRQWYLYRTPPKDAEGNPTREPGLIPNMLCRQYCGSPILFLTSATDVHGDSLKTAVMGWARDGRPFLLDYLTFEGDTEQIDQGPWLELDKLLTDGRYLSDDGREYQIGTSMIDSGYRTDVVYRWAAQYSGGVYPVKGVHPSHSNQRDKEYAEFATTAGQRAYGVTVDMYKERWAAALRLQWIEAQGIMPPGLFSAPLDVTDKQLRELTAETKVQKVNPRTGERTGWEWRRPSGAANELWDLLVYNSAAVDIIAHEYCRDQLELKQTDWPIFWNRITADVG